MVRFHLEIFIIINNRIMKLFKFYVLNEIILIDSDGSGGIFYSVIDFNYCNNYYNLEMYMI